MQNLKIKIADELLELLPSKTVFWNRHKILFAADLHLGKTLSRRSRGLYLPSGIDENDLSALNEVKRATGAEIIYILGDLFHDSFSLTKDSILKFKNWIKVLDAEFHLVIGNHDKKALNSISTLPIRIHVDPIPLDPFWLSHDPVAKPGYFTLCGHLHPGVRFKDAAGCIHKTKAFWLSQGQLILPAFGTTTSMTVKSQTKGEIRYLCTDDSVLRLPNE